MKKLNLNIQRFASTNKTANYNLPQFVGTDKPTWLGDFNEAMLDIDAGMHANATDIESIETIAQNASASASQSSQDVATLTSTVNTLSTDVSTVITTANNAQQTATSALNTANTANGKADTNASNITDLTTRVSKNEESIEDLIPTVLYERPNSTSGSGGIILSDSIENYDYVEVYFVGANGTIACSKAPVSKIAGTGTRINLLTGNNYNNALYIESEYIVIEGTTITRHSQRELVVASNNTISQANTTIYIIKVVGY